jgi:hypothetical protein
VVGGAPKPLATIVRNRGAAVEHPGTDHP